MNYSTPSQLESIIRDLDRWLKSHPSVFIGTIRNQIQGILKTESTIHHPSSNNPSSITPCERVSYEKCLDRIDEQIKYLKGQVSHDAWGPKYTEDQAKEMKDLKASRKQIVEKLGLPV